MILSLQMIGLYKDPTGINVFDKRYGSPNYDENDVVALRRDVQQLRVTLHFAQVSPSMEMLRSNVLPHSHDI